MLSITTPAEEIHLPKLNLRILIDGPTTGAPITLFEMEALPGGAMPIPHHHLGFDELIHGISGTLRYTVNGQPIDIAPGESLLVKAGEVHAFSNPFKESCKILCILTPGIFGAQYFRELRDLLAAGVPPDPKQSSEIMLRHGLVPFKPS